MISEIRKSFHSQTYKIVLWIAILAVAGVFSIPQLIRDFKTSNWIAKVNGQQIPYADFVFKAQVQEARIQMLRQQYGQFADLLLQSMGVSADPRIFAIEALIKESLVSQSARTVGLRVSPAFVAEKLASPAFVQQELSDLIPMFVFDPHTGINTQALRAYLKRVGMSLSDFEEHVDTMLERKVFMDFVGGAVYVPEFVLKDRYIADHLAKRYAVVHFNFGDYLAKIKNTSVSSDQIASFYEKNTKRYWMPEQRAGNVWTFDAGSYGIAIDEDSLNSYYNDHKKREFVATPVQVQVRRILFKADTDEAKEAAYQKAKDLHVELLKDPSTFAKKAQELSQDTQTAKQGGLMPFFERGSKHKSFDRAAFLLANNGDISDVIVTDDGVEILQRVEKKAAEFKPLSSVRKDIEKTLMLKKFKELFSRDAQTLSGEKEPALLAKSRGKVDAVPLALLDESSPRSKALFKIQREGAYGFYVDGDKGYVVQLTTLSKPFQQSMESVKDSVKQDLISELAAIALEKDLKEAKELAKTMSLTELKNKYKAAIDHTGLVKKSDTQMVKELEKMGIPVEKFLGLTKVGSITSAMNDKDGYIIRLEEVEPFKQDEFLNKHNELKAQLGLEYRRVLGEGFVASLGRNATITINESLATVGK